MNLIQYVKTGKKQRCCGFTLAELLAVVIIVSLMATFGIAYYGKSREQARFSEILNEANNEAERMNLEHVENALIGAEAELWQGYSGEAAEVCSPSGPYCVQVTTDYAVDVPRGQITCVGTGAAGKAFCESVGYASCGVETGGTFACLKS